VKSSKKDNNICEGQSLKNGNIHITSEGGYSGRCGW